MDFNIGDLVLVGFEDKIGVVIRIDMDPEGENHDISVLCGNEIITEFHHGIMAV